jgi:type IV pilus assembly protein PilP
MLVMSNRMLRNNIKVILGILGVLLLTGCSNRSADMVAIQTYADEVINRPGGNIEPLPEFVSYEAFAYSAAGLRAPFDAPVKVISSVRSDGFEVKPDESRIKELLEDFPVASLKMIGSLSGGDDLWILIQDEASTIHHVMLGDYLGRNHGRIVSTSESQVDILEIVPSGDGGWIERPQSIVLQE